MKHAIFFKISIRAFVKHGYQNDPKIEKNTIQSTKAIQLTVVVSDIFRTFATYEKENTEIP